MEMQKPYDKSALVDALKKQGIEEGEKVVKAVVSTLADWLRSSAALSNTGILGMLDDFAVPGVNYLEKLVNEKLDALELKLEAPDAPAPVEAPVAPAPAAPVAEAPAPVAPVAPAAPSDGAPSA